MKPEHPQKLLTAAYPNGATQEQQRTFAECLPQIYDEAERETIRNTVMPAAQILTAADLEAERYAAFTTLRNDGCLSNGTVDFVEYMARFGVTPLRPQSEKTP